MPKSWVRGGMAKPITEDEFAPIVRSIMRMVAHSLIESIAIQTAVIAYTHDPSFAEQVETAREAVRETWRPILDSLEQSTPESLGDILRKFEGPLQ